MIKNMDMNKNKNKNMIGNKTMIGRTINKSITLISTQIASLNATRIAFLVQKMLMMILLIIFK